MEQGEFVLIRLGYLVGPVFVTETPKEQEDLPEDRVGQELTQLCFLRKLT